MTSARIKQAKVPAYYGWTKSGRGIHLGNITNVQTSPQTGYRSFPSFCGLTITEPSNPVGPLHAPAELFDYWCGNCFRSAAWAALRAQAEALARRRSA